MSAFGGLILTNVGRNLQAKAQAGATLHFNRIAVGDGDLGSSSIVDLTALKHEVKSLNITKLKTLTAGKAVVGGVLSNTDLLAGFYWKELGLFAQDPDLGEILYCYGNSGANSEYIPAGGGPDIVEKSVDIDALFGNSTTVTATIDSSLIYASVQDLQVVNDALVSHKAENVLSQYKKDVTVLDANGNPTEVQYKRKADNTLAIKRVASNPDVNGFYQTVVEQFYNADGVTIYKTVTYAFTFLENGIIDTSDGGVIS